MLQPGIGAAQGNVGHHAKKAVVVALNGNECADFYIFHRDISIQTHLHTLAQGAVHHQPQGRAGLWARSLAV